MGGAMGMTMIEEPIESPDPTEDELEQAQEHAEYMASMLPRTSAVRGYKGPPGYCRVRIVLITKEEWEK